MDKLKEISTRIEEWPETVVLRLRNMPAIDAKGMQALEELADQLHKSRRNLLLPSQGARSGSGRPVPLYD